MIASIFNTLFYQPLYNGLVFLISIVPLSDVGIAVVVLTLLVKVILFPFTHKSLKTQSRMRGIEPDIKKLKEQHKNDKQQQAKKVMELYKKHGVNPFSGCLLFIIQIPIIFALYWVFWKGLGNGLDESNLYSFVTIPDTINFKFLGLIDVAGKSFILAAIAGITQYFQMKLSMPKLGGGKPSQGKLSLKDEFAKSFSFQMRYGLPVFVFFISYSISAAVALYWATSNIFSIGHELFIRKKAKQIDANIQLGVNDTNSDNKKV